MNLHFARFENGKKRINWSFLAAFAAGIYALVIGAAEVFWYGITGAFNPLIGLIALVVSTLIVIRVVGSSLVKPAYLIRAEAGAV